MLLTELFEWNGLKWYEICVINGLKWTAGGSKRRFWGGGTSSGWLICSCARNRTTSQGGNHSNAVYNAFNNALHCSMWQRWSASYLDRRRFMHRCESRKKSAAKLLCWARWKVVMRYLMHCSFLMQYSMHIIWSIYFLMRYTMHITLRRCIYLLCIMLCIIYSQALGYNALNYA